MNIQIILIAMFSAFLVFSIVIFCAFMALKGSMDETLSYMKNSTETIINLYGISQKYEKSLSEDMIKYAAKCDHQNEIYGKFLEVSSAMLERYKSIEAAYKTLLDCWKGIDERYDQTYDQFKLAVNKLDELHLKIEDLSCLTTEDEYHLTLSEACDTVCLDCPLEECVGGKCLVYQIKKGRQKGEPRTCDINYDQKCPYTKCVYKDCPIFVEASVTILGFDDPLLGK